MSVTFAIVVWGATAVLGALTMRWLWLSQLSRDRLVEESTGTSDERPDPLTRWLALAGYRRRGATSAFVAAAAGALVAGLGCAWLWHASGLGAYLASASTIVPGPAGALMAFVLAQAGWILTIVIASLPWVVVRGARRGLVEAVERDLPIALETLTTLGEAGYGFDAAVDRMLRSSGADRPLHQELARYRRDVQAGRPTVQALRRLANRLEVGAVTMLVSALVQAEQLGAGLGSVLRVQADDLRHRRRERALGRADALEVKLVLPLVVCFLPGVLLAALGPVFHQFFELIDRMTSGF